jgi:hypothetical protein
MSESGQSSLSGRHPVGKRLGVVQWRFSDMSLRMKAIGSGIVSKAAIRYGKLVGAS